jgi:hypothetical protein
MLMFRALVVVPMCVAVTVAKTTPADYLDDACAVWAKTAEVMQPLFHTLLLIVTNFG